MNTRALTTATVVGTILQVALVGAAHHAQHLQVFVAPGGMVISILAGVLYARSARTNWKDVVIGGTLAGGLCALIGIGVSVALDDTALPVLAFGTLLSALAGTAGGALGRALTHATA